MDALAEAGPVYEDRLENTSDILDIEEVPVVFQEITFFTILFHEGEHLRQGYLGFRFATEFSDDLTVYQGLPQLVVAERLFTNRVFDFSSTFQEQVGEAFVEVEYLHRSVILGVDHKLLFGDELAGDCGNDDRRDEL